MNEQRPRRGPGEIDKGRGWGEDQDLRPEVKFGFVLLRTVFVFKPSKILVKQDRKALEL